MAKSSIIVVLGASGDLAKKKTFPALFGVYKNGFLPENLKIVGYARTKMSQEEFRERMVSNIAAYHEEDKQKLRRFQDISTYVSGQYDSDADFQNLQHVLHESEKDYSEKERIFYLALPPSVFIPVSGSLKRNVYLNDGVVRVIVEKPFGKDLESSRGLSRELSKLFTEDEVYRIDHYLGKEMVKNFMVLRFANVFFESVWNNEYIDNVQITFKEPFGTEGRGGYFDEFGIIRDVMQNHLLQILTIVAMEKPKSLDAEDVRDRKVEVLRHIKPIEMDHLLIGQYDRSVDGSKPSYVEDDTVPDDSNTPTYAAAAMFIGNQRWNGVPFILKCGKALNERKTEVRIQFKDLSNSIFPHIARNELVMRVGPTEAVYLKIMNKKPGLSSTPVISELDMSYRRRYTNAYIPDAYESLLLDVFKGDHSNFVRDDELDEAWRIFTPILHKIDGEKVQPLKYPYGSRGPQGSDEFVKRYGFTRHTQLYYWPQELGNPVDKGKL